MGNGLKIADKKREDEVIQNRIKKFESIGQRNSEFIKKLFNLIIKESRKIQKNKINKNKRD